MKLVRWKRFTWPLTKLPPLDQSLPAHFITRTATREEARAVAHVVLTAFSLDSTWSDTLNQFRERLEMQLDLAFQRETFPALVITHGPRIIATSVLNTDPEADSNLVSGRSFRILQPRARHHAAPRFAQAIRGGGPAACGGNYQRKHHVVQVSLPQIRVGEYVVRICARTSGDLTGRTRDFYGITLQQLRSRRFLR